MLQDARHQARVQRVFVAVVRLVVFLPLSLHTDVLNLLFVECDHNRPNNLVVWDNAPATSTEIAGANSMFECPNFDPPRTKGILKVFAVMFSARTALDYREQCFGGQAQSLVSARC